MPLVKNTKTGNNYLLKINTDGDNCNRTAIRSYNKQQGIDGTNGKTTFFLPFSYEPSSHTLFVFVNGLKRIAVQAATDATEYQELTNRSVRFGAGLQDNDVIEFIIVGSYLGETSTTSGAGGLDWILINGSVAAVNGVGYMVDTTGDPVSLTLPSTPEEGDVMGYVDIYGNFDTNSLTIDANGNNVEGASSIVISAANASGQLVFDGVDNWKYIVYGDHNSMPNYDSLEHRKITVDTNNPTGGDVGDVWIKVNQ